MSIEFSSVHLPASLVADFSKLREKTLKIGHIGRILSVFRVENVFIYDDEDPNVGDLGGEASLIKTILSYMETPQYLRKALFPYKEELHYVGLLPPLRTPHHPLLDKRNDEGSVREATVVESSKDESKLEIGLQEEGIFKGKLEEGKRVTVKLERKIDGKGWLVERMNKEKIDDYWGFDVYIASDIAQSLSKASVDYTIGTSRYGQNLYEAIKGIKANSVETATVAFGGPYQGLFEVCDRQGVDPDDLFDIMVNSIPDQGTATVRTEEALNATLAVLNVLLGRI